MERLLARAPVDFRGRGMDTLGKRYTLLRTDRRLLLLGIGPVAQTLRLTGHFATVLGGGVGAGSAFLVKEQLGSTAWLLLGVTTVPVGYFLGRLAFEGLRAVFFPRLHRFDTALADLKSEGASIANDIEALKAVASDCFEFELADLAVVAMGSENASDALIFKERDGCSYEFYPVDSGHAESLGAFVDSVTVDLDRSGKHRNSTGGV